MSILLKGNLTEPGHCIRCGRHLTPGADVRVSVNQVTLCPQFLLCITCSSTAMTMGEQLPGTSMGEPEVRDPKFPT